MASMHNRSQDGQTFIHKPYPAISNNITVNVNLNVNPDQRFHPDRLVNQITQAAVAASQIGQSATHNSVQQNNGADEIAIKMLGHLQANRNNSLQHSPNKKSQSPDTFLKNFINV